MTTSDSPVAHAIASSFARVPAGAATAGLDGAAYRELLQAGLNWLESHHEIVNALNVFPVPDGDTGTNMLLTMKSALN